MRWRDIITRLEAVLSSTDGNGALPDRDGDGFMMVQTRQVYTAMCSCWNADIFIPELAHRFWRLTLQVRHSIYVYNPMLIGVLPSFLAGTIHG
jgi:hypothetical protein